jgi:Tol biopolymer transport system component
MYKSRTRLPLAVYIGFGFLLLSPRVISISPEPGTHSLSSAGEIRLEFNHPMVAESVAGHLSIQPGGQEVLSWEDDTLIIRPQTRWPAGETIIVRLSTGTRSKRILPTVFNRTWEFVVTRPRVAYLMPAFGRAELYLQGSDLEEAAAKITETAYGIRDYAVSQNGGLIVYTANLAGEGTELYALDLKSGNHRLLLSCMDGRECQAPALSPNGEWLAYEQTKFTEGAGGKPVPGQQSVWVMPADGSTGGVMVSESGHGCVNPDWSPSGLLAFFDNNLKAVVLMTLAGNGGFRVVNYIPNSLGQKGGWSPDGTAVVYAEIVFPEETLGTLIEPATGIPEGETFFFSHLYHMDLPTGRVEDISPGAEPMVEDSSPVYNFGGDLIAFVRRYLDQSQWALGRQIWIMQSDGSITTALTDDNEMNHSSISWSPDSERLLFMRGAVKDLMQDPEVLWMDVNTGEIVSVVEGGYLPRWVP